MLKAVEECVIMNLGCKTKKDKKKLQETKINKGGKKYHVLI